MLKRVALAAVVLAAAAGVGYRTHPAEFEQYAAAAGAGLARVWAGVEANPVPVALALATFLLAVAVHAAKGKSLRQALAAAATRGAAATPPAEPAGGPVSPVVERAKARATRAQLIVDQIGLQTRYRKLPDEVTRAEKEACYTEHAMADAERAFEAKIDAHEAAVAKLEALRKERAAADAELAEIEAELKKLADLV
ncbi:MAG: hypothetical protein C0501_10450 [Isosphaera sp.]|nr:hypothetical protein [Isosphaera sp.]